MIYLSSEELSALSIARKMLQDISDGYIGEETSSIVSKITNVLSRRMAIPGRDFVSEVEKAS